MRLYLHRKEGEWHAVKNWSHLDSCLDILILMHQQLRWDNLHHFVCLQLVLSFLLFFVFFFLTVFCDPSALGLDRGDSNVDYTHLPRQGKVTHRQTCNFQVPTRNFFFLLLFSPFKKKKKNLSSHCGVCCTNFLLLLDKYSEQHTDIGPA